MGDRETEAVFGSKDDLDTTSRAVSAALGGLDCEKRDGLYMGGPYDLFRPADDVEVRVRHNQDLMEDEFVREITRWEGPIFIEVTSDSPIPEAIVDRLVDAGFPRIARDR